MSAADLDRLVRIVWLVLGFAAGLGVVTMMAVQLVKDLVALRMWWQRRWIQSLVSELARASMPEVSALGTEKEALSDLMNLAMAGFERTLYGLPIEQLAGQLNSAAQAVLDFPSKHSPLLRILAAGAQRTDLETITVPPPNPTDKVGMIPWVDARNRVAHQVQRNLDALQIAMSSRWKLYLQIVSIFVSIGLAVVVAYSLLAPLDLLSWVTILGIGLLGGFIASVVRDLIASLQNLRTKK